MSAELGLADGRRVAASSTAQERRRDRWFFTGMAVAASLTVFVGVARPYYLKGVFGTPQLPICLCGARATRRRGRREDR